MNNEYTLTIGAPLLRDGLTLVTRVEVVDGRFDVAEIFDLVEAINDVDNITEQINVISGPTEESITAGMRRAATALADNLGGVEVTRGQDPDGPAFEHQSPFEVSEEQHDNPDELRVSVVGTLISGFTRQWVKWRANRMAEYEIYSLVFHGDDLQGVLRWNDGDELLLMGNTNPIMTEGVPCESPIGGRPSP